MLNPESNNMSRDTIICYLEYCLALVLALAVTSPLFLLVPSLEEARESYQNRYYGDVVIQDQNQNEIFLTSYAIKTDDSFLLEASTSGVDSKWSAAEWKVFHACLVMVEGGWMGIYVPENRDIYSLVHNVSQCAYGADHLID